MILNSILCSASRGAGQPAALSAEFQSLVAAVHKSLTPAVYRLLAADAVAAGDMAAGGGGGGTAAKPKAQAARLKKELRNVPQVGGALHWRAAPLLLPGALPGSGPAETFSARIHTRLDLDFASHAWSCMCCRSFGLAHYNVHIMPRWACIMQPNAPIANHALVFYPCSWCTLWKNGSGSWWR